MKHSIDVRARHSRFLKLVALAIAIALQPTASPRQEDGPRIVTDRQSPVTLPLPADDDAFSFVVFGDRTGGPDEGILVLQQAVRDANELDPDLVMTVGDLVQGYNTQAPWLKQMREFRRVMDGLRMPWFPVAGNHDIYWRGKEKPPQEHEDDYELHFGPLWYAFQHKDSWFVVLYSDEPNEETGERDFNKPQRMSDAQFDWLKATLQRASGAEHVFLFLHHPRWITSRGYGDDWTRVHRELAAAGNVSAVFAGHIHRMRYDGVEDGVAYYTLATVGGHVNDLPGAGYLHQLHVVTVRDGGIQVAAVPVGAVIRPEAITGQVSDDVLLLRDELGPKFAGNAIVDASGYCDGLIEVLLKNPTTRPVELTITPETTDRYFAFLPSHAHPTVPPEQELRVTFRVRREPQLPDANFSFPEIVISADYLADGLRFPLPSRRAFLPIDAPALTIPAGAKDRVLVLDGDGDCLRIDSARVPLPDGPFTLEGRLRARNLDGRRAFVTKTESSEYGLLVNDGAPAFSVFLGDQYVSATAPEPLLKIGEWHHVSGVFDGDEVRLYVDGERVASTKVKRAATISGDPSAGDPQPGDPRPEDPIRKRNDHPLFIGADPGANGLPNSFFDGQIDDVRLSPGALYTGDRVRWERAPARDAWVVYSMDGSAGALVIDSSAARAHAAMVGDARCRLVEDVDGE